MKCINGDCHRSEQQQQQRERIMSFIRKKPKIWFGFVGRSGYLSTFCGGQTLEIAENRQGLLFLLLLAKKTFVGFCCFVKLFSGPKSIEHDFIDSVCVFFFLSFDMFLIIFLVLMHFKSILPKLLFDGYSKIKFGTP